jgi:DNA-binding PadR family transcriptional regulator
MSESHDKRRRSDLDLFVLALIECGVSTPYELRTAAGLSPGATIPVLARLLEERFIVQAKPGSRGRTEHKITAVGRQRLKSGWYGLIEQGPSGDLDADLRTALLALWVGNDHRAGKEFLRKSADQLLNSIETAEESDQPTSQPPLAYWYRSLRLESAKALAEGQSSAALALAKRLPLSRADKKKRTVGNHRA